MTRPGISDRLPVRASGTSADNEGFFVGAPLVGALFRPKRRNGPWKIRRPESRRPGEELSVTATPKQDGLSYPHNQSSPEKASSRSKFSMLSRTLTIRHRSLPPFFGPRRPLPIIWK